jgi:hypothetical protein
VLNGQAWVIWTDGQERSYSPKEAWVLFVKEGRKKKGMGWNGNRTE